MPTYDAKQFARACNPKSAFNTYFHGGDAELLSGDTMPVDFVTESEIRTFQVVQVYCPAEHRWLRANKISHRSL